MGSLRHRLEELLLLSIIILDLLDFFDFASSDLRFLKVFISWTVLGYLLFRMNITKILFGNERKGIDFAILISCFLLIMKNLYHVSFTLLEGSRIFHTLLETFIRGRVFLEAYFFLLGCMGLVVISWYLATKVRIDKPSLMHIIHDEGDPPASLKGKLHRFATVFSVLIFFFVVIFNFALEWLGMLIDAPLALFAILFYIFIIIRHHRRFDIDHYIFKVGNFGESFYMRFIEMFGKKRSVLIGLSGILILHLVTETGVFIIPLVLGFKEVAYLRTLEGAHTPLFHLFQEASGGGLLQDAAQGVLFAGNALALCFFFILPGYIWFKVYQRKGFRTSHLFLAAFFFSATAFLLKPVFSLERITATGIAGVDIVTHAPGNPGISPLSAAALALGIGFAVFILSMSHRRKEKVIASLIIMTDCFFGWYIFLFSLSLISLYLNLIASAFTGYSFLEMALGKVMLIAFLITTAAFYLGSYVIFLTETKKEFRYVR